MVLIYRAALSPATLNLGVVFVPEAHAEREVWEVTRVRASAHFRFFSGEKPGALPSLTTILYRAWGGNDSQSICVFVLALWLLVSAFVL